MRSIDIPCTQSRLRSIVIIFPEDSTLDPDVTATIHLLGPGLVKISEYSATSNDYNRKYNKEAALDLPQSMYASIALMHDEIEHYATAHAQSKLKMLPPMAVEVTE